MKRQDRKPNEPTMMLLRLFRIADLLATAMHEQFVHEHRLQRRVSKTQD